MNLLSGMEKFGFSMDEELDILKDDSQKKKVVEEKPAEVAPKTEKDFILDKKARCPICDKEFIYRSVLNTKIKRLEPDFDLRPNTQYIDKLKYDFISCPRCGYSALDNTFSKIDSARARLVRKEFCANFKPELRFILPEVYSYDYSIEKFKLALICTMKKRAKMSEKAYVCLKISWLRRGQIKELEAEGKTDPKVLAQYKAEEEGFYRQAYEGFMKALTTEAPPYCGMASDGVEFMLANMANHYGQYDAAAKLVARLIQSPNTSRTLKDKCVELKNEVVEKMAESKNN